MRKSAARTLVVQFLPLHKYTPKPEITMEKQQYSGKMPLPPYQGDLTTHYYKDMDILSYPDLDPESDPFSVAQVRHQPTQGFISEHPNLMQDDAHMLSSTGPGGDLGYTSYNDLSVSGEELHAEPFFASSTWGVATNHLWDAETQTMADPLLISSQTLYPGATAITPVQQASIGLPISNDLFQVPPVGLNNFQWNNTDASIRDESEQHSFMGDNNALLTNLFSQATSITIPIKVGYTSSGTPESSSQSWEQLNIHNLTPSQSGTEEYETIPRDKADSPVPTWTSNSFLSTEYSVKAPISTESSQALRCSPKTFPPNSANPSPKSKGAPRLGAIRTKETDKKKRGKLSTEGREKAKKVRKIGACIRCRIMGVGVSILSRAVFSEELGLKIA